MGQGPSSQGWRRRAQARRRLSSLCAVYRRRTPRDAAVCAYSPSLLYGRLYGIRLYFAVFSCISLHTGATPCPASLLAPYSHTTPYSTIQRCMSIQPYSTIHHTAHTAPLSTGVRGDGGTSGQGSNLVSVPCYTCYRLKRVLSLNRGGNAPTVGNAVFRGLGGLDTSLNQHRTQRKP